MTGGSCWFGLPLLVFVLLGTTVEASAATYYIDSSVGSDTNNGTSILTPWKSFAPVNGTTFQPGDRILLRAGGVWIGDQLHPLGSGNSANAIRIDKYGSGPQPRLVGNGVGGSFGYNGGNTAQGVVYLQDQSYWEIRNLDVSNTGPAGYEYVGIKVRNTQPSTAQHIYISNNVVHDVNGIVNSYYGTNAGIAVTADMNTANPCCAPNPAWNNVRITNNNIYSVDRTGIFVGPDWQNTSDNPANWPQFQNRISNVAISGNKLNQIGGDGILTFVARNITFSNNVLSSSGTRIINSVPTSTGYYNGASAGIWTVITDHSLIEHNEVYFYAWPACYGCPPATRDGEAFDSDIGTTNQIIEYNYSHNNWGGMLLTCDLGGSLAVNNQRVRYNVSYNDRTGVFRYDCGNATQASGSDPSDINNNLVYLSASRDTPIFYGSSVPGTAYIYNNIFYVLGATSYAEMPDAVFDFNIYYGNHPASEPSDNDKLISDPTLVSPGSAGIGRGSVGGFRLGTGSPALASGTNTGYGIDGLSNLGPQDYWGNPVSPTAPPNRGAYDGNGLAVTSSLGFNAAVTASSSYETEPWLLSNVVDGQIDSILDTYGYSSQVGEIDPTKYYQHEEWLILQMEAPNTFSQVVLYPRNDRGMVGQGFPLDFTIEVWDGSTWLTRVSKTNHPKPTKGQVFTWGFSDTTDRIRIHATRLRQVGADGYLLQFAEIGVYP